MKKLFYLSTLILVISSACTQAKISEATPTQVPSEVPATETPEPTPTQIPIEELVSLPYVDENPFQKLDVYLPPTGDKPYPTILAIHGGFGARSKSTYKLLGRYYARQGYAFVPINFRLTSGYSYPAQVADSFCALAWLHNHHKEYGFDPNRVIVTGASSGGYMAAMLATIDDPGIYLEDCPHEYPSGEAVQAAVIYYGFYDFTNIDDYPVYEVAEYLTPFWGAEYADIPPEKLEEMSPIKHIDGSEPPFIILHQTADPSHPSVMSERFAQALEQAGIEVELVLLPDVDHTFEDTSLTSEEMTLSLSRIETFLDRVLAP